MNEQDIKLECLRIAERATNIDRVASGTTVKSDESVLEAAKKFYEWVSTGAIKDSR